LNWEDWLLGSSPRSSILYNYAHEFNRYLVYSDPGWTIDRFNFARDRTEIERRLSPVYDAADPDLSRFAARGGKLVMFHGWSDMALQPRLTIDYYKQIETRMGAQTTAKFVRLYMVPGMAHVIAGNGPNAFGQVIAPPAGATSKDNLGSALIAWVENGTAPGPIVAAKYSSDFAAILEPEGMTPLRTRPLCSYPQVARWTGQGSSDEATNFKCAPPPG
jgi:feruloyl esterase